MLTRSELVVLRLSEAFSEVWGTLGEWLGVSVREVTAEADLAPALSGFALLIAAGGEEVKAIETLPRLQSQAELPPHAVVGAEPSHRIAARTIQLGAQDYFALPDDFDMLRGWLEECQRMARQPTAAVSPANGFDFSAMIGESEGLRAALDRASRVIPRDAATVLITGETGTGKELLAEAIHTNSPRARGPFIGVNCAAIPATLLEAELFGYEAGAFTDARGPKPGLFEGANGGTLFLDEIGDLPIELQAKILRVLEDRTVRRLGSVRRIELDIRLVAATNADLLEAVHAGRFRQDLYYRLHVVPLHLPALRDRGDDVIVLAEHFLKTLSHRHDMPLPRMTESIRAALRLHHWPGNIRELRNTIERALLLGGPVLTEEDLFIPRHSQSNAGHGAAALPARLSDVIDVAVRRALEATGGNKKAAAAMLGVSRSRLYRLLDGDLP